VGGVEYISGVSHWPRCVLTRKSKFEVSKQHHQFCKYTTKPCAFQYHFLCVFDEILMSNFPRHDVVAQKGKHVQIERRIPFRQHVELETSRHSTFCRCLFFVLGLYCPENPVIRARCCFFLSARASFHLIACQFVNFESTTAHQNA
jgi:hypothetical protein